MLNDKDYEIINSNLCDFYHIPNLNNQIFGEPFLENNYLYYFDGDIVTIVSQRFKEVADEESINQLINHLIIKHNPENIIFWGEMPKNMKINTPEGFNFKHENLELWRRELVVHAKKFVESKKYRRYLRKAKEDGMEIRIADSSLYKSEHLKLFFETHKDQDMGIKTLSYYSLYPNLDNTKLIEIVKGGKIVSVNIIVDYSPRYVCFAEIGFDSKVKNCSGLSKALLFEYFISKTEYISWGGSANENIFNFKKELIGDTPFCFFDNLERYHFYKKEKKSWWLTNFKV